MNKLSWLMMVLVFFTLSGCGSPEEKVQGFVESAKKHIEAGDYDSAHIEFRNALKINPNHIDALYHVTKVFEHEQNWKNSYRYLEKVLELAPNHVEALISIGTIELSAKQLDKALERSQAATKIAPNSPEVRGFNSVLRMQLGDMEGAVAEAKAALAIDANNEEATIVLAAERLSANDPAQALVYLDRYKGEEVVALSLMKVRAYNVQKDLQGAVSVIEGLISSDPQKDEYHYTLAKQYLGFNKTQEADAVLRAHLEQKPSDIDAKLRYIQFLNRYMGEGRSVAQLKEFIKADPKNLELNFGLAEIYQNGGHIEEAKGVLISLASFENVEGQVSALNRLAKLEFSAGNIEKGDQYLQQALVLDPESQEAIVTRAQRTLQQGNIEQAISELRSVLRDSPDSAIVLGLLGNAHEKQGKLELALDQYAKAYDSEPNNRLILIAYTQLLKRQGQYSQIEKVLDRYLLTAPSDVGVLKLAAENKLALRNWGDAQVLADRLDTLKQDPSIIDQIRGSALLGMDNQAEGIAAFERAYEVSEDKSRSMVVLVRSYLASDHKDKAKGFLESVLKSDADNLTAMNLMAQLHQLNNDIPEAEALYQAAVKAHPENLTTYQQLSSFWMRQGRPEAVIELLENNNEKVADNAALLLIKAGAYEAKGAMVDAIRSYDQVLKLQPELDVAANNLAVLLSEDSEHQDLDRAKQLAIRFKQSEVPYFLDTLGWIYYKTGDFNNALYFHENAVRAMPEFAEFRYHLGMSYKAAGENEKAKTELTKAIELSASSSPSWKNAAQQAVGNL